jgi:hypothetical protein
VSKGHRNIRKIARRVRHDMELSQRRHDRRLMRELLAAVAKVPLSDVQIAQVRTVLLEAVLLEAARQEQARRTAGSDGLLHPEALARQSH